ncbi:hypothetical protein [Olivibacter domesticus]|uniref:Uncharacterized protein n=1 Tax=Olivibacter domesticus TaxID=407022 RepID=A0A1H7H6U3_OLID1|nr:hypothetical protein [Olivibacter domesticus]SEK45477.1 hypothetical protein SAMN05661044_00284 [Olivibacter domesticus]
MNEKKDHALLQRLFPTIIRSSLLFGHDESVLKQMLIVKLLHAYLIPGFLANEDMI